MLDPSKRFGILLRIKIKLNLHYACGITPKFVTSGGAHLHGLALGNTAPQKRRSSGDWRAVGDNTVSDLIGLGIKHQTFRSESKVVNRYTLTGQSEFYCRLCEIC